MPLHPMAYTTIKNRRARHEYYVEDSIECGLVLYGTEVKSLRMGKCNMGDSYAAIRNGEVFVQGMHISPYEKGNIFNRDPMRDKKLLLNKAEIRKLQAQVMRDGYTLIPLSIYFKGNRAKLELGVCKGKKLYDKRATAKAKDDARDMDRAVKAKMR